MADRTGQGKDDAIDEVEPVTPPRQDGALIAAGAALVLGLLFCALMFLVAG